MNKTCLMMASLFLWWAPLWAQQTTATISGEVQDQSGAVLPVVTVLVLNVETGISRSVVSDDLGRYLVPNLPPGKYEVRGELSGFKSEVRRGITLTVGREAVVNLRMSVGEISEQVVVTGEAPLVETSNATIAGLFDEKRIRDLPLNGRSFVQLAVLEAGVNPMLNNSDPSIGVAGGRSGQNNFLLDGTTSNDQENKTPVSRAGVMLGVEAIREFTILTSNYGAEFGRGGGGIINAVTKSGTNELHGSVFAFHRNDNLDARNFFDEEAPPEFKRNQFGFSLGGPIVKNRTFSFGTYEGFRQRLGVTQISRTADASLRQGPAHPAVRPYLDLYPLPNGQLFGDGTGEFIFTNQRPTAEDFFQVRVDHKFSDSDSFFARYTFSDSDTQQNFAFPQFFEVGTQRNQYVTLEENKIFSPSVLNVLRAGLNRTTPKINDISPGVSPSLSFVPGQVFGNIAVTGLANFGTSLTNPQEFTQNIFQYLDNLTVLRGKHSLKFGGLFERIQVNLVSSSRVRGSYNFESLRDFLENRPSRFEVEPPGLDGMRGIRQSLVAWYLQDDIKLSPNFTVNIGLRHEFITTPTEVNGKVLNIRDIFQPNPVVIGDPFIDNPSHKNFAPRLGLAWDPFGDGRTSIRSGFGIYFDPILAFQIRNAFSDLPPLSRRARINDPPFPNGVDAIGTASFLFLPKNVEFHASSAYMVRWNLSVQRELLRGTMVSAGYVGSRGVHLMHLRDINEPLPTAILPDGREFRRTRATRRNTAFSEVRESAFDSSSHYHSLQVNLKRSFGGGLQAQGSYTLSRSIDTASGYSKREFTHTTSIATTPRNINFDRGLSNFDVRHTLVSNFSVELPFGRGRRYLPQLTGTAEKIVGGWELHGIVNLASGNPVTVRAGFDRDNNDETDADRPDLRAGRSNNPVLGGPDNYFDPSGFALPEAGFRGNLGRNTLTGPGLANVDFSLFKNTILAEGMTLQFRLETFNLFNRANFAPPLFPALFDRRGRPVAVPGRITRTVTTSREIQLGLKLIW